MQAHGKQTVRFGPFEVDLHCGEVSRNGLKLKLQHQPIQVLGILLEKPSELITREEFRQRLWPADTFVDFEHSLNTDIKKLRQALGDEAETPRYIETLPRQGYRFIGELESKQAPDPFPSVLPVVAPELREEKKGTHRWRSHALKVGLVAGIGLLIYLVTRPPPIPRIVGSHQITRDGTPKWAPVLSDGARLYFTEVNGSTSRLAQVALSGGEVSYLATPTAGSPYLRDISPDRSELLLGVRVDDWSNWALPIPSGPARRLPISNAPWAAWTSDGRDFLYTTFDNELFSVANDGSHLRRLLTAPGALARPRMSPDGKRIRFNVTDSLVGPIRTWEAGTDGSDPHRLFPGRSEPHMGGDWSRDGKLYFFVVSDGAKWNLWATRELRRWPLLPAPTPVQLTQGPLSLRSPLLSDDGKTLYAIGDDLRGELSVHAAKTGRFVPFLSGISVCHAAFTRDGQWVAYVAYPEGTLWRSRIDGSERLQLTFPPMGVINPRWSPDGKLILFMDIGPKKWRIYLVAAAGGTPMLLLEGENGVADPTWSADGNSFVYGECIFCVPGAKKAVWIYDIRSQHSTKIPGSDGLFSPRSSPDGRSIVATSVDQKSQMLYRYAKGKWEELGSGFLMGWQAWSRDSKYVYVQAQGAHDPAIVRFRIADHKMETVVTLKDLRLTAYGSEFGAFTLSPDDRVLIMRDVGTHDIYSLALAGK